MGKYSDIGSEIIAETRKNVKRAAEEHLKDANEVVPVDTGRLKASGHLEEDAKSGDVSVVYDTDYAEAVHENPEGRGYKFLHGTLIKNEEKYGKIIEGDN